MSDHALRRRGDRHGELFGGGIAAGFDAPITFDTGKRCWIQQTIFHQNNDPAELLPNPDLTLRQVFTAGDSDTDIAFIKDATVLKLAINRNKVQLMCNAYENLDDKWLIQPMFISPKAQRSSPYPCTTTHDAAGNLITDEAGNVFTQDYQDIVFTRGP